MSKWNVPPPFGPASNVCVNNTLAKSPAPRVRITTREIIRSAVNTDSGWRVKMVYSYIKRKLLVRLLDSMPRHTSRPYSAEMFHPGNKWLTYLLMPCRGKRSLESITWNDTVRDLRVVTTYFRCNSVSKPWWE